MSPENENIFNNQINPHELSGEEDSFDNFMKELEQRERELHITSELPFLPIDNSQSESEIAELEKVLELYEDKMPLEPPRNQYAPSNFVNLSPLSPPTSDFPTENNSFAAPETASADFQENASGGGALDIENARAEAERQNLLNAFKRKELDFNNLKNRTEREREDFHHKILNDVIVKILPVLDNIDRAVAAVDNTKRGQLKNFDDLVSGVLLVKQQMDEVLSELGIYPIPAVARTFDPHFHEAVSIEKNSSFPPNTVTEEILRGYRTNENIIRHSLVKVSYGTDLKNKV